MLQSPSESLFIFLVQIRFRLSLHNTCIYGRYTWPQELKHTLRMILWSKKNVDLESQAKESGSSHPLDSLLICDGHLNPWPRPWKSGHTGDRSPLFWAKWRLLDGGYQVKMLYKLHVFYKQ